MVNNTKRNNNKNVNFQQKKEFNTLHSLLTTQSFIQFLRLKQKQHKKIYNKFSIDHIK